jgi:UDP-N-acetylglucosamine diphosphorylase/glucosamine-1-phosphate N-acetyltransferase
MKAVVLAAGEGVRLQPITATRPKHLIEVGGKPVLEHCFEALKGVGIVEVVVVTHYMGDAIRQRFCDGRKLGLKIEYVEQSAVLGTGNALSVVEPFIDGEFVLVYGDLLFTSLAMRKVIDAHSLEKAVVAMAVVQVEKPKNYGVIEFGNGNTVKRVVEKPAPGKEPSRLANAGLYVLPEEIFDRIRQTRSSVRGEWELTDAISLIAQDEKAVVTAEISKEEWIDIGSPWDLLEANAHVLKRMKHRVLGTVEDGAHLVGSVTVAENARVRSGAYIEGPSFVGDGSDVGPNCYIRASTSIGRNVRIGNACEVKNSIIMDRSHVGHLSYVGDSILCEDCNLGAGTITANYRLDSGTIKMSIKDKMVDSGRRKLGAVLADNVKTGVNALLMPGVKIGVDSWIGPNFTVHADLPANTVALLKQVETRHTRKSNAGKLPNTSLS